MRKVYTLLLFTAILSNQLSAQLAVTKLLGKSASQSKLGFETFLIYDYYLDDAETRSIRLELLDFAYIPGKGPEDTHKAFLSIKAGYKYTFGESKTGFYVAPAAGYVRVVFIEPNAPDATHGDGFALAFESGYCVEVGQRGNTFNFALKYEWDKGGGIHTMSSVGFRVSYSFGMFNKEDY